MVRCNKRHSGKTVKEWHSGKTVQTLGRDRENKTLGKDRAGGYMWKLNLRLFDGGAAGGAGAAGAAGGPEGEASAAGAATGAETGVEGSEVQAETGVEEPKQTPEERMEAYQRFKEEYKDLYGEDVKKQIERRYAPMNRMQEQLKSYDPLMQMLSARYGTDAADIKGMMAALEADNAFYEEKAMEAGMPVDRYKEFVKLQAQNKAFEAAQKRSENIRQEQETWARWDREAEECRRQYPGFDIRTEIETNQNFVRLLGSGADVLTAYRATHFDDIAQNLIARSEKETKKRAADTIRAGAARPVEGAAGSTPAASRKLDIMGMSSEEFAQLRKDMMSGKVKL